MGTPSKYVIDLDGLLPVDVLVTLANVFRSETVASGGSADLVAAVDSDLELFANLGDGLDLDEYLEFVWFYTDRLEECGVTVVGY